MTANALQTTETMVQSTQWSPPELPARLASLVAETLPEIVPPISADEASAVQCALAVYDAHPKGSSPRQINKMMTKLALAYPNAKLSVEEAGARMELYEEMLADIDLDILGAGFRAAVMTCKFFPSVSEIRELAMKQPATPRMQQMFRLRQLLHAHQTVSPVIEPPATPEQIGEIKAELSDGAKALLDRVMAQPETQAA